MVRLRVIGAIGPSAGSVVTFVLIARSIDLPTRIRAARHRA